MKRVWFLIFAVCLVLPSCVKDIVLDAGEEPKVVVECVLTEDPVQELYLSYTKGVSQTTADPLPEAEALLVDLDEYNFSVPFSPAGDGRWVLDYAALPGHRYRLEVKVPGHGLITAETKMPDEFEVGCHYFNPASYYLYGNNSNYRGIKYEKYGYSGGMFYYSFPDHCWIHFIYDDGSIAETICTNFPGVDDFNLTGNYYVSDSQKKRDILKNSFDLLSQKDAYSYPVLIGEGLHDRYLRMSGGLTAPIDGSSGTYVDILDFLDFHPEDIVISGSFNTEETGTLCFECYSPEYDQYLASAMRAADLENSADISRIYMRENILEPNIQGGLGIFGAKIIRFCDWINVYSNIDYLVK